MILRESNATGAEASGFASVESARTSRDRRLQLSRRIDWRFLLPHLQLRRVALCGPHDEALRLALEHFSDSFTLLDNPSVTSGPFDLVVFRDGGPLRWHEVLDPLAAGGVFFSEIERRGKTFHRDRSRTPGSAWLSRAPRIRSALEAAGLTDVRLHWHRPSFRTCREILPLDEAEAFAHATRGKRGARLLCAALRVQWLSGVVPSISVLARKLPGSEERE